jgi:hypothetical protein
MKCFVQVDNKFADIPATRERLITFIRDNPLKTLSDPSEDDWWGMAEDLLAASYRRVPPQGKSGMPTSSPRDSASSS